jgi:hypothetical protein
VRGILGRSRGIFAALDALRARSRPMMEKSDWSLRTSELVRTSEWRCDNA